MNRHQNMINILRVLLSTFATITIVSSLLSIFTVISVIGGGGLPTQSDVALILTSLLLGLVSFCLKCFFDIERKEGK